MKNDYLVHTTGEHSGSPMRYSRVCFYGQRVSYDPHVYNAINFNHVIKTIPLSVDDDDDPTVDNDRTTESFANTIVDAERLSATFVYPIRGVSGAYGGCGMKATVEASDNTRITTLELSLATVSRATGAVDVRGTRTLTVNMDGPGTRHVNAYHDMVREDVAPDEVLAYQVKIFGRQVASNAVPSVITLWHSRGGADTTLQTDIVTSEAIQ